MSSGLQAFYIIFLGAELAVRNHAAGEDAGNLPRDLLRPRG